MEKLLVSGGTALNGTITASGSKNSSLPILAATLLTKETCIIRRVPDVSDTNYMIQILTSLGAEVERASGVVIVKAEKISHEAPYEIVRKMRASICILGPLMARMREARVSLPGGCVIGDRPVDIHLRAMEELGAEITMKGGDIYVRADTLRGCEIDARGSHGSTVLGTDNIMMAAVLAEGTTVIEGAAREPEVIDLAEFLIKMGAKIQGAGTNRIVVEGVEELGGVEHEVIPDRIEAGTFLVAACMAGGNVTLRRVCPDHMEALIDALTDSGHRLIVDEQTITFQANGNPKPGHIVTEPYPGFPTDMQAQMCALYALIPGTSTVHEKIFPQRFMHLAELSRMGADCHVDEATAIINGVDSLSGAPVMASDLRASAALVLAGLRAEGTTEINRLYHIDRGYEHIDEKLMALGAQMRREKVKA